MIPLEQEPTVAVVVTTYNHARFLGEALDSVLAQTRPADEIIVVDDGSQDQPETVVALFPEARLLTQRNQGLSAARNSGLQTASTDFILFLDADDRLLPDAIKAGLVCHAESPGCAFVYGGHYYISATGTRLTDPIYLPMTVDSYTALLEGNLIGMHATVLYRRAMLKGIGGFDVALRNCEDYDAYLRLARQFPVGSHRTMIAEYRKHGTNMSSDHRAMLRGALMVQARSVSGEKDPGIRKAAFVGRQKWQAYYARALVVEACGGNVSRADEVRALASGFRIAPRYMIRTGSQYLLRNLAGKLPTTVQRPLRRLLKRQPPPGSVRFGDLGGTSPINGNFGYGRGTPIDRLYIQEFLDKHSADITGRVLEVGDDSYSRQFGGARVTRQDVLHVHAGNPTATIVGDLSAPGVLPTACFDCVVLTQTLHLVYDLEGAVARLHDSLRPGGVLLVTVPGISQVDRHEWADTWYWALTPAAATRLFGTVFGERNVSVESHGNVFAATSFLHGLAVEEVSRAKLMVRDPAYPLVVTVRAHKTGPEGAAG